AGRAGGAVGVARLGLAFHGVSGRVEHIRLGTARPSRDPRHLAGLFAAKLDTVDPGLGIEDMILAVFAAETLPAEQLPLNSHLSGPRGTSSRATIELPPPQAGEGWGGGLA